MENDTKNAAVALEADENCARYAETMGGRMRINWDSKVEMSTNAHHVLFSEFLALGGLFDEMENQWGWGGFTSHAREKPVRGLRQHCVVRRQGIKPPRPLRSDEKCGLNPNCFF